MELKIYRDKVEFNESNLGNSKDVIFVEFPNCISKTTNKPFKWMPTYRQLDDIKVALAQIEVDSWNNLNKTQEENMAKITEFVKQQGEFLKAKDISGEATVKIVGEAIVSHNEKYNVDRLHIPISFANKEYTFDCSKTNAKTIVDALGDDTKNWVGKSLRVEKYKTKTTEGKMTDAINVKAVTA